MYQATVSNPAVPSRKALNLFLWAVQIASAVIFVKAALPKLGGDPQMIGFFQLLGLGQWFRLFTGGVEFAGAVGLVIPRLSGAAALLLVPVMAGAIVAHLVFGGSFAMAAILLIAMAGVAWTRREEILALLGR
jgi:putative oxidoreductase